MNTKTTIQSYTNERAMDNQQQQTDISEFLVRPENISLLKVNTDIMLEAGIGEGDVVAVDREMAACNNNIVVAMIENDMVIRKLEATGGKQILVTPGRKLAPLDVTGRLNVWGVVKYVIRKITS